MEVEYKDRCEEVFAIGTGMSVCVARLDSSSAEACSLREQLYAVAERNGHISGCAFVLSVRIFENFGEDAFRVTIETR